MLRAHPSHRSPLSRRTLRVESLERRCLLSNSPLVAVPVLAGPIAASPAALVAAAVPKGHIALPQCHRDVPPPVISNFTFVDKNGFLMFTGTVSDANYPVAGLKVQIDGVKVHLTATVNADGTFSVEKKIPKGGIESEVTAQTECHGQKSNVAEDLVVATT